MKSDENLQNYLLQDHRFLILVVAEFNENINPAVLRKCFLAGSRVRSGPCFHALSLWLKCWSYLFSLLHGEYQSVVTKTEPLCVPTFSLLVSKRPTHPSACFMSLFRSICLCSSAISVLVRQLGKNNKNNFPPVLNAAGMAAHRNNESVSKISQMYILVMIINASQKCRIMLLPYAGS